MKHLLFAMLLGCSGHGSGAAPAPIDPSVVEAADAADQETGREDASADAVAPRVLVFDGNSITAGWSAGYPFCAVRQEAGTIWGCHALGFPYLVARDLGATWSSQDNGLGGASTPQITASALSRTDPLYDPSGADVAVLNEGTNDYRSGCVSSACLVGHFTDYVAARHLVGWRVVLLTLTPSTVFEAASGVAVAAYTETNAAIRAGDTRADAVADVAADPVCGAWGAQRSTTYYADGIHPVALCHARFASIVLAAIKEIAR